MKITYTGLKITTFSVFLGALCIGAGCKLFGSSPSAPSALESKAFNITTNIVDVAVIHTNIVTTTNVVNVPNPLGVGVPFFTTNILTSTNMVTVTNQVEQFQLAPKAGVVATLQAVGAASGPFTAGIGTMVASGLVALYGLWAGLRSNKMSTTSAALTQEIEAVRNFIQTLPNGTKIDSAVTTFMQQHQTEAGVAQTVLKLIDGNTSDPTIAGISSQLQQAIAELTAPPAPPKV